MGNITRRVFLKRTISSASGIMLARSLGSNVILAQPPDGKSRIVVTEHTEATDGKRTINAANVQTMMDESIKQLTGETSVADAWASLLPDFRKEHVVAIKVNCVNSMLSTHPVVVDAIVSGLVAAGVQENNIIVHDIVKWCLLQGGYKYNMSDTGVRYFATLAAGQEQRPETAVDEEGWGYDEDIHIEIWGQKRFLSTIITRCDHLINVPVLKSHDKSGVTLSLKNHYGSVDYPWILHSNLPKSCAILNSHEAIKDKTRLIVIDALFGCWRGPLSPPDFAPNSLILSQDPVAADYTGTEMINEECARLKMAPRNARPMLEEAAKMGLGTNDPENMELVELKLGPPAKEEDRKAVDPADSYKTQWGGIKSTMRK